MNTIPWLTDKQLIDVLSLSKTATAIHITEDAIIQIANQAMLDVWDKDSSVIGKTLEEALPELKGQPFIDMFKRVWNEGLTISGTDTPADIMINGVLTTVYFDFEYRALKNEAGEVYCILHTATDITDRYMNKQAMQHAREQEQALAREQSLNEQLAASNEELSAINEELQQTQESLHVLNTQLEERVMGRTLELSESEARFRTMIEQSPVAMMVNRGDDLVFESMNAPMIELIGKGESVIGKPWFEAIPELRGQRVIERLYHTYRTGEPWNGVEEPVTLVNNGRPEQRYYQLNFRPLMEKGRVVGVLQSASDITEQVINRKFIEQNLEIQQALNEELAATNEELALSNDELALSQERIKYSESRLDQIISQLPAPIVVLQGPDQVVMTTNQALLSFWNKTKEDVLGKPMLEIFPELATQPFPAKWKHVLETGESVQNREQQVVFNQKDGSKRLYYVDYYYQPLADFSGKPFAVLATVIDVTDKVLSRQQVEQAENKLRLAMDSSEMGTWFFDLEKQEYVFSERLKEIFGRKPNEDVTIQEMVSQITDEYRDLVIQAVSSAIENNTGYAYEYSIVSHQNKLLRWVKATGKLYPANGNNPANFSGTIMDITDRKLEEQRKDDFISIASHELKTPITTLRASLQLLDRMKDKPATPILPRLIDQSNKSVERITGLIDDLLNSTRTTEGQLYLNKTNFTISDMLNECCNHVRMAGKHQLIFQGDVELTVFADEHRIDQVVVNLVNNAVKYAPDSKDIYLIAEKAGNVAKISVKDNGPGIAPDKIPHLFDRYYRADYAGAQYSGLGLGLYISAEIIKRHGGQIGVDSEVGKGSTFWFTLPL